MKTLETTVIDALTPRAGEVWREIEARAKPPYFLSWGWMDHWLSSIPHGVEPELVVVSLDRRPVMSFFLGDAELVRHGVVHSRARVLNASGMPRLDELCIEHNAVLVSPDVADVSLAELIAAVPDPWDELVLPALAKSGFPGRALDQALPHHSVIVDREVAARFVDLDRVRRAGAYLPLLSASARSHLRRSERAFGTTSLEVARDTAEAIAFYDEMVALSRAHWHGKRVSASFDDPWFTTFHRRLIEKRFARGEIELSRLRAGGETLGCLYNLVSNGRVLFYQGGFAHFDDPHKRPGYVAHAKAIERAAAAGHAVYDFLGGEAAYKRSLATDEARLVWARVQKPHLRFAFEEGLRRMKHAVAQHEVPPGDS